MEKLVAIQETKTPALPFGLKLLLGSGSLYTGAVNVYIIYYAVYLTDIIRLSPVITGLILFMNKLWDAFSSPLFSRLANRVRAQKGYKRGHYLLSAVLVFVSFFLLWFPPSLSKVWVKCLYVLLTSLFFRTVYSMVMQPYLTLKPVLTKDKKPDRALELISMIYSIIAFVVVFILPLQIQGIASNEAESIHLTRVVLLGLFFSIPWLAIFFNTRKVEHIIPDSGRPESFFKQLKAMFTIKAFRNMVLVSLFVMVAINLTGLMFAYYIKYYIGRSMEVALPTILFAALVAAAAMLLLIPGFVNASKPTGRVAALRRGIFFWLSANLLTFFYNPDASSILPFAIFILFGFGVFLTFIAMRSFLVDLEDVSELILGTREANPREGNQFITRLFVALAHLIGMICIAVAGFVVPSDQVSFVAQYDTQQTNETILTIQLLFSLIPAILLVPAFILSCQNPLTASTYKRVQEYLNNRRMTGERDEKLEEEFRFLLAKPYSFGFSAFKASIRAMFPKHRVVGAQNVESKEAAIFVCNHQKAYGPIAMTLYLPFFFRPWVVYAITDVEACRKFIMNGITNWIKLPKPIVRLAANVLAPVLVWVMKSVEAIPVYREESRKKIFETFYQSMEVLKKGISIVMFPERETTDYTENIKQFRTGFAHIGRRFYDITGIKLNFYPVFGNRKKRTITIGKPIIYDPSNHYAVESERIAVSLMDAMDTLSRQ